MPNLGLMTTNPDELLSVEQVAELLHISPRAVRHRALVGTLPAIKMPGRTGAYIFRRGEIDAAREAAAS